MTMEYLKLGGISQFKVVRFIKIYWQMWDDQNKRYLRSDNYAQGYAKRYEFETESGIVTLSNNQLGLALVSAFTGEELDGKAFTVKTNGKAGKDVRYYLNLVRGEQKVAESPAPAEKPQQEEVNVKKIPFQ